MYKLQMQKNRNTVVSRSKLFPNKFKPKKMLKIFISKICKYKQGQKYENINIFSLLQNTWDVKACGARLSKEKICATWSLKVPWNVKMACVSLGVLICKVCHNM